MTTSPIASRRLSSPRVAALFVCLSALASTLSWGHSTTRISPGRAGRAVTAKSVVFVSPDGDDNWSGRLGFPDAGRRDGPYRTLAHALLMLRSQPTGQGREIRLRGGFYSLNEPLTLGTEDSGPNAETPVVITADRSSDTPVLSGGVRLLGWKNIGGNHWQVTLPDVAAGKWYFSQLYINGERRYRPRLPSHGYYRIAAEAPPSPAAAGHGFDQFGFKAGDIDPNWTNRSDIEVLPFHIWSMSRFDIADIDVDQNIVRTAGIRNGSSPWSHFARGNRYLVENVKEALSEPGEWYLDRPTGVLIYLAKPGEDPNRDEVVAPRLERLCRLDGVAHLTIRGITFADAAWNLGPQGSSVGLAETGLPAAIALARCNDVAFEGCTVRNTGGCAVEMDAGTQHCRLDHCVLRDLGAGGVKIGYGRLERDDTKQTSYNTVTDCVIAEGGRLQPSAEGVWIGQSSHNTVAHNEIVDFYYTGISVGTILGYAPGAIRDNTIAYNHVHRIGQRVLSDMGGIYTMGISTGTVIDHNLFHGISTFDYGGWGIYFDEGSSGVTATNNVCYDCKSSPFDQHYGINNVLENNILALGREAELMRTRADNNKAKTPDLSKELSFTIKRNIVYWDSNAPLFGANWKTNNYTLADNIYWDAAPGSTIAFPGGATFAAWQTTGEDSGSLIADPRFAAPDKGDFSLPPDSPAAKTGFVPIDLSTVGPRNMAPFIDDAPPAFPVE